MRYSRKFRVCTAAASVGLCQLSLRGDYTLSSSTLAEWTTATNWKTDSGETGYPNSNTAKVVLPCRPSNVTLTFASNVTVNSLDIRGYQLSQAYGYTVGASGTTKTLTFTSSGGSTPRVTASGSGSFHAINAPSRRALA